MPPPPEAVQVLVRPAGSPSLVAPLNTSGPSKPRFVSSTAYVPATHRRASASSSRGTTAVADVLRALPPGLARATRRPGTLSAAVTEETPTAVATRREDQRRDRATAAALDRTMEAVNKRCRWALPMDPDRAVAAPRTRAAPRAGATPRARAALRGLAAQDLRARAAAGPGQARLSRSRSATTVRRRAEARGLTATDRGRLVAPTQAAPPPPTARTATDPPVGPQRRAAASAGRRSSVSR